MRHRPLQRSRPATRGARGTGSPRGLGASGLRAKSHRAIWGFTLDDFTDDDLSAEDHAWLDQLTWECAVEFAAEQGYDLKNYIHGGLVPAALYDFRFLSVHWRDDVVAVPSVK